MNSPGPNTSGGVDARDEELLGVLRECYERLDPMPPGLIERSLFALTLHDLDASLVHCAERLDLETVGTRGKEARVVTFEGASLTVMIRISPRDGALRIDGWLAPPRALQVDLRTTQGTISALADSNGRFVMEGIPRGLAQLVVKGDQPGTPGGDETMLTPAIML